MWSEKEMVLNCDPATIKDSVEEGMAQITYNNMDSVHGKRKGDGSEHIAKRKKVSCW